MLILAHVWLYPPDMHMTPGGINQGFTTTQTLIFFFEDFKILKCLEGGGKLSLLASPQVITLHAMLHKARNMPTAPQIDHDSCRKL